ADPTILVADEPTGDLDAETATATLALLRRLNRELGKTLVMVTHDPKAAAVAGRLVHLEKGKIVGSGQWAVGSGQWKRFDVKG
ncbi:MAG TPA: hypothetical protein VIX63_15660, partial [Vicinamibacterales bacterium]